MADEMDYMEQAKELADSYRLLVRRRDLLRQQYEDSRSWFYTKDEIIYKLSQGAHEESERVQTSGTSNPVERTVLNCDKVLASMNREVQTQRTEQFLEPYYEVCEQIELFEIGLRSLRGQTRLVAEQLFVDTGGIVAFGYKRVRLGRVNKKNQEVCDLVVDEAEAEIVRLIFHKYVYEGYGAQKLSHYLYEQGVVGRNNKNIPNTSIVRMIKNKGYMGYLINGAVETECPQLRIIEPELFEQAQELRQARTCERGGTSLGTSSKALLTGLVYCGHCGNRLSLTSSGRTHTYADGHTVKEVRPRYSCFYKIRHPGDCDGQSGYGVSKLDSIVEEVVRQIFAQFREVSRKKLLESVKTNDAARIQKKIKKIQKDLEAKQKELDDLKAETILVIRGVSALDKELLGTLVAEAREALETLEKQLVQAQEEYEEATKTAKRSNYICNELFTWADVYDTANHDERRAILQQFITEIRVRKDYEISITLNASFNQVEQLKAVSTYDGAEIF